MNAEQYRDLTFNAYNARWLTPEEVGRSFVLSKDYERLLHLGHGILAGPRGSGKTTLLKMLNRRAYVAWKSARDSERNFHDVPFPPVGSIYIPSDIRWLCELSDMVDGDRQALLRIRAQRILINLSTLEAWLRVFDELTEGKEDLQQKLCIEFIKEWVIVGAVASPHHIKRCLLRIASSIRAAINGFQSSALERVVNEAGAALESASLDISIRNIQLIDEIIGKNNAPERWFICYDELELAPDWLQAELLNALRSIDQRVYLKLTWSPVLPRHEQYQQLQDVTVIRLWYSHVNDAYGFCEALALQAIRERFPDDQLSLDDIFGRSVFTEEEVGSDYEIYVYRPGGTFWKAVSRLAQKDPSFFKLLLENEIDPSNPYTEDSAVKDRFIRKAKPIVLLRDAFLGEEYRARRTRKSVTLYAGKEVLFRVSEGNPRDLKSLLGMLLAEIPLTQLQDRPRTRSLVPFPVQARIVSTYANIKLNAVRAVPVRLDGKEKAPYYKISSMYDLIESLGKAFGRILVDGPFDLDPVGSVEVAEKVDAGLENLINAGLARGFLVCIGKYKEEVPISVTGLRFRLNFAFAPIYRLVMQNLRSASLVEVLNSDSGGGQLSLFTADVGPHGA